MRAPYLTGTAIGQTDPAGVVRVLLGDGRASFSGATAASGTRLSAARADTVTATRGTLRLADGTTGRPVATLPGPVTVTVTGPAPLRTAGGTYRGALVFNAHHTESIQNAWPAPPPSRGWSASRTLRRRRR